MASGFNVAVAGATGAVGVEMIKTLEKRNFPVRNLKLLASARSAGKTLKFKGEDVKVEEMTENSFRGVDIALFSAGGDISKAFRPAVVGSGAIMIDNSSAFRMEEDVPLVVPEVNPEDVKWNKGVIANRPAPPRQGTQAPRRRHLPGRFRRRRQGYAGTPPPDPPDPQR